VFYGAEGNYVILHKESVSSGLYVLDASKAFDRVKYCKLFRLLIKQNVPDSIIRVLINFYMFNYVQTPLGELTALPRPPRLI